MRLKKNYVIFKVTNYTNEKVIKEFANLNISITLIYNKKEVCYKSLLEDFKKIQKQFPYYEIDIIRYDGIIYFYYLIKKYKLAIFELLCSFVIVFFLSFIIVDIEIETSDVKLKSIVKVALENENIKPFIIRKKYNQIQLIKDNIKKKYSNEIDWLEITKKGMKYIVNVEKREKKTINKSPNYCNIYAKKSGMIKRVKTYNGVSQVSMNDYVSKDDLLISGDIKVNDKIVSQICANGVVYAEVWYTVNIKIPLYYYENIPTNKVRNNIVIEYADKEYPLLKNRLKRFDSNKSLIWEILGVKIYKRKDVEIKRINKKYTLDEAIDKAQKLALEKVRIKLKDDEKIISQKVLQKQVIDSTMNVDIFIITEEKIGYSNIEG